MQIAEGGEIEALNRHFWQCAVISRFSSQIKNKMDLRIEHIFREEMKGDTSFQEKESGLSLLFGTHKYSKVEMRETWDRGIKYGIEIGLRKASLEGQRIELNHNTPEGKHKEFLEKFYQLAAEYKCAIQYQPEVGMVVVARQNGL